MITTGAQLWQHWIDCGLVRPGDYDRDLVDLIGQQIGRLGAGAAAATSLGDEMERAGWSAQDLIRAVAPAVTSFVGMQRDLLAMYSRIGATSATEENLRIEYEFDDGHPVDFEFSDFRETVAMLVRAVVLVQPLRPDPNEVWNVPARDLARDPRVDESLRHVPWDLCTLPPGTRLPRPKGTGNARLDRATERWVALVEGVLELMHLFGRDRFEVMRAIEAGALPRDVGQVVRDMASDVWLRTALECAHGLAIAVRDGTLAPRDDLIAEVESWLTTFAVADAPRVAVEQLVAGFVDVLSMPMWGRRHELYSAWVVTQIDEALDRSRLVFELDGGTLRFPFRATRIAKVETADGSFELWSELRSTLVAPGGRGRTSNVQPDHLFIPRGAGGKDAVLVVEAKQYLRAATRNPADALVDYLRAHTRADVMVVAHGPLGTGIEARVPAELAARAHVHRHVRPGRPVEQDRFRAAVAKLLQPPVSREAVRVELSWDPNVADLDLHITGGRRRDQLGEQDDSGRVPAARRLQRRTGDRGPRTGTGPPVDGDSPPLWRSLGLSDDGPPTNRCRVRRWDRTSRTSASGRHWIAWSMDRRVPGPGRRVAAGGGDRHGGPPGQHQNRVDLGRRALGGPVALTGRRGSA